MNAGCQAIQQAFFWWGNFPHFESDMAVRINSANPAMIPNIRPAKYNQLVCSHRSRPAPMSHPTIVAAGKMKANWL
jgi:hypothetical protein